MQFAVGVLVLIAGLVPIASAEDEKPTNDEIAKELANPNTALTSLKFQFQYFSFDGDLPRADDQDMFKLFFQPTLPFPLRKTRDSHLLNGRFMHRRQHTHRSVTTLA